MFSGIMAIRGSSTCCVVSSKTFPTSKEPPLMRAFPTSKCTPLGCVDTVAQGSPIGWAGGVSFANLAIGSGTRHFRCAAGLLSG